MVLRNVTTERLFDKLMETCSTNAEPRTNSDAAATPKGIFVVSAVFLAVAVLCLSIVFNKTIFPRWFGILSLCMSLLISFGMAFRLNVIRMMLIQLLVFGLLFDAVFVFRCVTGLFDGRLPVAPTVLRIALVVWTIGYLMRRDVRAAFDPPALPAGETEAAPVEPGAVAGGPDSEESAEA